MATLAPAPVSATNGDERFFMRSAIVMALVIVAGFSLQLGMGRSSFASPLRVHVHAIFFMGWVVIYLMQNVLVARDQIALHRRLGWLGTAWVVPMVVMGCAVTVAMVRQARAPFFFRPLHFLIFDPLTVFTFAGLTVAAVAMRRRTEWHRRLHFCGMALLVAPGFGRLIPAPLLQPWAWEASVVPSLLFPLAGMVADIRRTGRIHPAWHWGMGAIVGAFVLIEAITYSPVGTAIYRVVAQGSPGAAVPPLAFAPPPEGGLVTGPR